MARLRTIRSFIPWLVGVFLVAQLAGIVPRVVDAQPSIIALVSHDHLQHTHDRADQAKAHQHDDQDAAIANKCCALHLLNGVVPFVVAFVSFDLVAEPLSQAWMTSIAGIEPGLLFRPPRSPLSA